ncbi:hypothetical protein ANCDUO_22419 [Ancylostoma duodenale]|uniref:Uncharacterized protein n=1 Tax=Ancylostoma duodenale TaxID=51022 RepID=A0A0C2FRI8_9BILA|nr:hypothetical protein ANCDUO_22419 [Ancylostoma duodenale]
MAPPSEKPSTNETSRNNPTRIINTHRPPHTRPTTTVPPDEKDDVTIVTALMDIGRGDWDRYRRPLEQYHIFMENLLSLQNNMVIFTDTSSYDFIHKYRKNMGEMHRTKIHLITLNDLPLSRHLDAANKIIQEERQDDRLWRSIWDPAMKDHPEARSAEYDVLVNSKTYFLYNATLEDPFSTEFFVWIDAGYGHGNQSVFPYSNKWKPRFPRNKISLIKVEAAAFKEFQTVLWRWFFVQLTPVHDSISGYTIDSLYRRNWSVVSGGFVAGDKRSIGQLHTLVHRKFIELTYHNKVDDDQTVLVLVINQHPHLFSITHGDWFDAFRLFGPDEHHYMR